MKQTYDGFEAKRSSQFAQLPPPGCYVAEIQGVKTEESYDRTREVLVLMLEITEGEYKGQYHKVFEDQRNSFGDNVKYRGTIRLTPYMEGDEAWVKSRFQGNLWCIQESNKGYTWDWDEKKLKGKAVGINVRKKVYTGRDGQQKETTEIGQLETVSDVREGKAKPMKDRIQRNSSAGINLDEVPAMEDVTNEVEVPF